MCNRKISGCLLFFALLAVKITAQITASPSFTGCAPFSVVLSGPSGATQSFWTFGGSAGTSTLSSPNPIFPNPGNYVVTYSAMVNNSPVTYTAQVVVKSPPTGSFNFFLPPSHCAPMTVTFSANGSAGSMFQWDFGDLGPLGSGSSVTHMYNSGNSFTPALIVTDATSGCTVAVTNSTIPVSNLPIMAIQSSNGYYGCTPPFTTTIDGSAAGSGSPLGGGLTYSWQFITGNPASSSAVVPGVISFGSGQHTINVTVTDNNQCSSSNYTYVTVAAPSVTAVFPGTVCVGAAVPVTLTTNQTSATITVIGTSINTLIPTVPNISLPIDTAFFLFNPGTFTVVTTVQPPNCQSFTVSQTIFVEQVVANYSWNPPYATCQSSMSNTYINLSTTNCTSCALSFTWQANSEANDSHHGTPASSIIVGMGSPTFTFLQGSLNPYTMYKDFAPEIVLFVESNSAAHCRTQFVNSPYIIHRPSAAFLTDKKQGCAPLEVKFYDKSTTHYLFPITGYTWCNGASPPTYSSGAAQTPPMSVPNYSFAYSSPGVYHPYLLIETAGGCRDSSFLDSITVVMEPTVTATFPSQVCAGQPVTISMNGTIYPGVPTSTVMDHWHISTDNNFFSGCITNPAPTFSFTHPGIQTVVATAYQAHCGTSTTLAPTIQVKGPVGKFRCETTCTGNKKEVKINVHLQETSTATLYFGDGGQTSLTGNVSGSFGTLLTHIYPASNDYTVKLISASSNGCPSYTFQQVLKIRDPKASITYNGLPLRSLPEAALCTKAPYKFSGAGSTDNFVGCTNFYTWYFQSPTYTLSPLTGTKNNFRTDFITVPPPNTPQTDTIYQFVDGFVQDTFRTAGIYTIGLAVKDINGCVDSTWIPFRVTNAEPVFSVPQPLCYSDGTFQLTNTTQNSLVAPDVITSYTFDFGDMSAPVISTNPYFNPIYYYNPVAPPSQTFNIMCIAENNIGCRDSLIKKVQVNNPLGGFYSNLSYPCIPMGVPKEVLFNAIQGYATYSVTFGEPPSLPAWNSTSSFSNVSHYYAVPGVYHPTLTVIDADGCKESESLTITALGQPTAHIAFPNGVNGFCRPAQPILSSSSSIYLDSIYNFIWSIGNISSFPPGSPTLQTTFIDPVTTVSLTVSMTQTKFCPSTTTVQVFTYDPVATAAVVPTLICLGSNLNASIHIDKEVARWKWFFGDFVQQPYVLNGPFSPTTVAYPYNIYPASTNGDATVTLIYEATDNQDNNCRKTEFIPIRIIDIQSDFKNVTDIYAHCLKIPDTFSSTAINLPDLQLSYDWNFGDQGTGSGISPLHNYMQAGVYTVTLTTSDLEHSCVESSVKQMTIFPLPTATLAAPPLVCGNTAFVIEGSAVPGISGIVTGTLQPQVSQASVSFGTNNTFTLNGSISQSSDITLIVTDDNGCKSSSDPIHVVVQEAAPHVEWDTTVVIGEPIPLNAYVGADFTYTWTPLVDYLNCSSCVIHNPISTSSVDITYSVSVEDGHQCSVTANIYRIHIELKASLDVPSAFTPNGDGVNDLIFPAGWGLRKLNYFRVFNRWGQLVFETNDLSIGWDGIFRGVPQNMDTYVYQASAETLVESQPTITKSGTFKLLR